MEKHTVLTEILNWDYEGSDKFEVTLEKETGKPTIIKSLRMCMYGPENIHCFHSTNIEHIVNVHKACGELIKYYYEDLGVKAEVEQDLSEQA